MRPPISLSFLVPCLSAIALAGCASSPDAESATVMPASTAMSMSSAMGATSAPSSSTSCAATQWKEGSSYRAGTVVSFQGKFYVAKEDNPGYVPTVSTYFWAPQNC